MKLLVYCAEHLTGGRIPACIGWNDTRWLMEVGIRRRDLGFVLATGMAVEEGTDVVVKGYDHKG
ncbi:MAG TPA: hypothetical protein VD931_06510, partial [Baekduia sp.]|nr:hypothetical protein [Baekduia sp.]